MSQNALFVRNLVIPESIVSICAACAMGTVADVGVNNHQAKRKKPLLEESESRPKTANRRQQSATAAVTPPPLPPPPASSTPETEVNYKSLCRQLQQKNQQLGKAYKDIKTKFDALERKCLELQEHLQQAQDDSDEDGTICPRGGGESSCVPGKDQREYCPYQGPRAATTRATEQRSRVHHRNVCCCEGRLQRPRRGTSAIRECVVRPGGEEMQPQQCVQNGWNSTQHHSRCPGHRRTSKSSTRWPTTAPWRGWRIRSCQWKPSKENVEDSWLAFCRW